MRSKIRTNPSLTPLILVAAAILSPPAPAAATPCLTHAEARAKWPDAHLWWHTDARCFDNHRYGAAYYEPRSNEHASSDGPNTPVDQATEKIHTTVYYPAMEVNAWPEHPLPLVAHDMSSWPVLLDVDAPTKFDAWRDRVKGAWSK